jgi:hypothetical protein
MNFSPRTLLIYVISQASRGAHVRIVLGRPKAQLADEISLKLDFYPSR